MINQTKVLDIKDGPGCIRLSTSAHGVFFLYSEEAQDYNFIRSGTTGLGNYIHHCREILAEREVQPGECVGFYMIGLSKRIDLFSKFWDEIEKNFTEKSEIYRTSFDDAIIFKINSFWGDSKTSRQFFSLFLRAGAVFHEKNDTIEQTLGKYKLSKEILSACKSFLGGNTINVKDDEITWNNRGIYETFRHLSQLELSARLIKPAI